MGAIVGVRWRPRRPLRAGMLLVLAWPVQDGLFALGSPIALVVAFAFATGFGFSLLMIWWETALARHIPPGALSRVSAWDWLGYLVAGPLAELLGARLVLGLGSAIGLALLALGLASRSVRGLSDDGASQQRPELGTDRDRISPEQFARQVHVKTSSEA